MKKFIVVFSILLFLSFNMNNLTVMANPVDLALSEGIYIIQNINLIPNVSYTAQNTSSGTMFMIVIDDNQQIMQAQRLLPQSIKYTVGPFKYSYKIVILGPGKIEITD